MIFTSINFLLFFPLLVIVFYITPLKWRSLLLFVSSIFFYLNISPIYFLLLLGVSSSTFGFTYLMSKSKDDDRNSKFMIANIILILLPLFFFKYFQVINNFGLSLLTENGWYWPLPQLKFILPVGISFYTFVAIGYTIDVYNEDVEVETNFGILTLFISFFPLILSGPIERAPNMLPQFRNLKQVNFEGISAGLKFMLWGYFMKIVVADRLSLYIDPVYNDINNNNGSTLLLATALYPFQVYADLGGYSLIAIGTAKVLGLEVMQNFKRPFFATSMAEFWRRWHISLITWLTDYVYTPLSFYFRKYKIRGIIFALVLTFLISGIWHGAAITFIVWGILQGFFVGIEALTQNRRSAWENRHDLNNKIFYPILCMVFTYVLFTSSEVFGRASTIADAITVYKKIFTEAGNVHLDVTTLLFGFFGLIIIFLKDLNEEFFANKYDLFSNKNVVVRYFSYLILIFIIILFGVFSGNSFIYFQF